MEFYLNLPPLVVNGSMNIFDYGCCLNYILKKRKVERQNIKLEQYGIQMEYAYPDFPVLEMGKKKTKQYIGYIEDFINETREFDKFFESEEESEDSDEDEEDSEDEEDNEDEDEVNSKNDGTDDQPSTSSASSQERENKIKEESMADSNPPQPQPIRLREPFVCYRTSNLILRRTFGEICDSLIDEKRCEVIDCPYEHRYPKASHMKVIFQSLTKLRLDAVYSFLKKTRPLYKRYIKVFNKRYAEYRREELL